jgi:hypothetical protein
MRARKSAVLLATCFTFTFGCGSSGSVSGGTAIDEGFDATGGGGSRDAAGAETGGNEAGPGGSTADGGTAPDGSTFACGETTCNQSEVCLHQACGCVGERPSDSGTCPGGESISEAGFCEPPCGEPYCWSPDAGTSLECDGSDGGLSGVFNDLPPGMDLVCYSSCL